MSQLDLFLTVISTTDVKKKISIGNDIINYLQDPSNGIECEDIGSFIDGVVQWLLSSNFRVSQNGLDVLASLIDRMRDDFRPYLQIVIPPCIDRLGDTKDSVRDKANVVILKCMEFCAPPQQIFERMIPGFGHKSQKVREEVLTLLQTTLNTHSASSLSLNKIVPSVVKLLSDPAGPVREIAFATLVEIYRHVGDRFRQDLLNKQNVPPSKLPALIAKFDEILQNRGLLPTATRIDSIKTEDEPDKALTKSIAKRSTSAPPVRRNGQTPMGKALGGPSISQPCPAPPSLSGQAGAMDEALFIQCFEEVPKVQFFSAREMEENMQAIREVIANTNNEWDKRVIALKKVRSMVIAGAAGYDEFYQQLRLLEPAFLTSVKDLRSLVVREACVGIAFFSQQFGQKFDHFAESLLPALIGLIPNSAKVISTSGIVAVRFIIAHTHSPRLIPVLTEKMNNKSKEIRRQVCEFLDQLVHAWPVQKMERHVPALQEAIKKGIGDAEQDARASARRAYYGFADHFKDQAANLLNSLDPQYKKALHCDQAQPMSNSSSHSSLNNVGRTPLVKSKASSSTSTSTENLQKLPLPRRPAVPTGLPNGSGGVPSLSNRSNSAIELQAVQRSKLRAQQYATAQRMKIGSGASLPRPMKKPSDPSLAIGASPLQSPDHTRRPRGNGISQSQPSSRSGSPSSRLSYATYTSQTPTSASRRPGTVRNPKSSLTSRETSPSRAGNSRMSKLRTRSIGTDRGATPQAYGTARPVMAQKILQQSREAESALADALATTPVKRCGYDDHSDESETSSLCSDRSFDSYHRRASDARSHRTDYSEYKLHSWSGSQQRLYRDIWDLSNKDVGEIINQCASTHWNERKDGLLALQPYFQSGNTLTIPELKRLTEIFTRMFTDAHTKVFGIFLDALTEFIIAHKSELTDWLYVLLTRLFNKLGADLLGSIQTKIYKTLDLVRESFAYEQQFSLLIRFLTDATQTPNTRVKVAVLNYLHALCTVMDPGGVSALLSAPSSMPLSPGLHGHTGTKAMETAIMKLVSWTGDPKSMDVRRASEETLVALFNLNPGEITKVLNNLPKNYQDNVQKILQSRVNRSLDVGDLSRGSTPLSTPLRSPPVSLLSSTPATPMSLPATPLGHPRPRPGRSFDDDLNPEEIQRSIRKTTEEIQNYGFNSLEGRRDSTEKLKRELSDEGIISSGSPRNRQSGNGLEKSMASMHLDEGLLEPDSDEPFDEKAVFVQVIAGLQGQKPSSCDDRRDAIKKLIRLLSRGHGALVAEHFKAVLRLLLDSLNDPSSSVRKTVYIALSDLLATPELSSNCTTFAELLILRILSGHKDAEKEVVRAAEMCAGTLVQHLPFDSVVRVLRPIIQNGEFPENQAAIKTLTRAIERQSKETLINVLPEIMPGLVQAYDSPESIVRKAAVFSMVALHLAVGEGIMQRYYESLNSSKLKLLNLYIKRAESQSASASQSHTPTMAESPKPQ